ncbi:MULTISPECIES: hypothetical protein, partial [Pseudanabaena]
QDFRYLSGAGFKSSFFFWCHLLGRVNLFLFYPSFLLSIYTQCLIEMLPLLLLSFGLGLEVMKHLFYVLTHVQLAVVL